MSVQDQARLYVMDTCSNDEACHLASELEYLFLCGSALPSLLCSYGKDYFLGSVLLRTRGISWWFSLMAMYSQIIGKRLQRQHCLFGVQKVIP